MRNAALEVDPKRYGRLLARKLPRAIRTAEECQRLTSELLELDAREELTPEEEEYGELLTVLIVSFEDANVLVDGSTPATRLQSLMEERGLRQRDLVEAFGSRGIVSAVVGGKRTISPAQAKKLATLFHVPADLFF